MKNKVLNKAAVVLMEAVNLFTDFSGKVSSSLTENMSNYDENG